MFGLTFDKLLIIGFVAVLIVGPARLPGYAAKLAQFVKTVKSMADSAKGRLGEELGPEFEDLDWKKLDPRQYDPRRIIAGALLDEPDPLPAPVRRVGGRHAAEPVAVTQSVDRGELDAGGTAE